MQASSSTVEGGLVAKTADSAEREFQSFADKQMLSTTFLFPINRSDMKKNEPLFTAGTQQGVPWQ